MDEKINIGVVGCANIAQRSVIPAILNLSEKFKLVAVASRTINKAAELARRFNCEAVEGYDNIINSDRIDALYIPLPTGLADSMPVKPIKSGTATAPELSCVESVLPTLACPTGLLAIR